MSLAPSREMPPSSSVPKAAGATRRLTACCRATGNRSRSARQSCGSKPPELLQQVQEAEAQAKVEWKLMMTAGAIFVALPGVIMIVLGVFVRRGGFMPAVLGIVLTILILLFMAANILKALVAAGEGSA